MSIYNINFVNEDYNKLLNKEDMLDHHAIGGIIKNKDGQILILDHVKFNMLTLPVGKADPGETPFEALVKEVGEETNIQVKKALEFCTFPVKYDRNGKIVNVYNHVFLVTDWTGIPMNKEPNKHRNMFWLNPSDFMDLNTVSDTTNVSIDCLDRSIINLSGAMNTATIGRVYPYKTRDTEYTVTRIFHEL